jgi:hypothetical protein
MHGRFDAMSNFGMRIEMARRLCSRAFSSALILGEMKSRSHGRRTARPQPSAAALKASACPGHEHTVAQIASQGTELQTYDTHDN